MLMGYINTYFLYQTWSDWQVVLLRVRTDGQFRPSVDADAIGNTTIGIGRWLVFRAINNLILLA